MSEEFREEIEAVGNEPVEVRGDHYQQALCFYFEDANKGKKTSLGKQIDLMLLSFGYRKHTLDYYEIWNDVILYRTKVYFEKHEKNPFNNVISYIMFCIKREVLKYTHRKRKYYSKFEDMENIDVKNEVENINCRKNPSIGLIDNTPSKGGYDNYGALAKFLNEFLKVNLNPIQFKVYELTYKKGMTDKEIAEVIHLPQQSFKGVRQLIRRTIELKKYDILNAMELTEDDFAVCEE